jgi:ABC-type nickel/cobalt efflux system permease component RcnA
MNQNHELTTTNHETREIHEVHEVHESTKSTKHTKHTKHTKRLTAENAETAETFLLSALGGLPPPLGVFVSSSFGEARRRRPRLNVS